MLVEDSDETDLDEKTMVKNPLKVMLRIECTIVYNIIIQHNIILEMCSLHNIGKVKTRGSQMAAQMKE